MTGTATAAPRETVRAVGPATATVADRAINLGHPASPCRADGPAPTAGTVAGPVPRTVHSGRNATRVRAAGTDPRGHTATTGTSRAAIAMGAPATPVLAGGALASGLPATVVP